MTDSNGLSACAAPLSYSSVTTTADDVIELELFLRKSILIWKNTNSQDVLKGLDSTKFLEILHSNKIPNKFSNHQLKIAFKHPNFVRELF